MFPSRQYPPQPWQRKAEQPARRRNVWVPLLNVKRSLGRAGRPTPFRAYRQSAYCDLRAASGTCRSPAGGMLLPVRPRIRADAALTSIDPQGTKINPQVMK
jgi:hypothetical protein